MPREIHLREDGVHWRVVEGEVVALEVATSEYLAIAGSGRVIWEAIAEGATRTEIVERVTGAYDVDPTTAAADVDAFLATLDRRGLLRR